jgi:hypothetical protein
MRAWVALGFLVLALAGCGGGSTAGTTAETTEAKALPGTLRALWEAPARNVTLVMGTSDYAPGEVRASFLVVDNESRAIFSKRGARLWLARGFDEKPIARGEATLETISVPGASTSSAGDTAEIYVARFTVSEPGTYWLLAEPIGAAPAIRGVGNVVVRAKSASPAVGAKAFPSSTPTLATVRGDVSRLTTRTPPDRELLRISVAEALRRKQPFVVAFATPRFCASRTCGPVVDVVDAARKELAAPGVGFIHVEIFEDNDPALGYNRWVKEWKLPSEPWVFLVGADGRIAAKFEGPVSVQELVASVRQHLL